MASSFGGAPVQPEFNDSMKAMFGAVSTFALLVIVCAISALEGPVFGQTQLPAVGLDHFVKGGAFIVGWFFLLSASSIVGHLFALLATTIRLGPTGARLTSSRLRMSSLGASEGFSPICGYL